MSEKNIISKIFKNKKAVGILIIVTVVLLATVIIRAFIWKGEREITSTYLGTQLLKSKELTTTKLKYAGIVEYKDNGIFFITKANFVMSYEADARIGIDVDKVGIDVDNINKIVWLKIPKAQIQDINVDESKIKYYNEKFAIINLDEKEDANKAIALAEEQAKKELKKNNITKEADEQAFQIIKDILDQAVPSDYKIKERK